MRTPAWLPLAPVIEDPDLVFRSPGTRNANSPGLNTDSISDAAEIYAAAFRKWAADWARGDDENAERICGGYVSITGMLMPADCVLRASQAAIHALRNTPGGAFELSRGVVERPFV